MRCLPDGWKPNSRNWWITGLPVIALWVVWNIRLPSLSWEEEKKPRSWQDTPGSEDGEGIPLLLCREWPWLRRMMAGLVKKFSTRWSVSWITVCSRISVKIKMLPTIRSMLRCGFLKPFRSMEKPFRTMLLSGRATGRRWRPFWKLTGMESTNMWRWWITVWSGPTNREKHWPGWMPLSMAYRLLHAEAIRWKSMLFGIMLFATPWNWPGRPEIISSWKSGKICLTK